MSETFFTISNPGENPARLQGNIQPAPLAMLGPFRFTFASTGLTTGRSLIQLPVGAIIYDIGILVGTAFDGTTPLADVGTFSGNTGLFDQLGGAAIDLTVADAAVTDNAGVASSLNWLSQLAIANNNGPFQLDLTALSTLSVVATQSGQKGGTATGATAGAAAVYVLAATPTG